MAIDRIAVDLFRAFRLPVKFNRITGKMLIETNMDKPGDVLHVFKNDFG